MTHPHQPPHQQHYGPQGNFAVSPPPAPKNGLGTTALVLGIVGLLLAWLPFIGFIGFVLGALGLVLGLIGWSRTRKGQATNRGPAIAGVILSVIAIVVSIAVWTSTANAINDAVTQNVAPAGSAPAGSAPAPGQQTDYQVGQAVDMDGLVITVAPLQKVHPQYSTPVLCSDVTYKNNSSDVRSYNPLDWKLQTPAGNIVAVTYVMNQKMLNSGELAPGGGNVAGQVCFEDPKQKGDYWVANQQFLTSSTPVRWKATL